MRGVICFIMIAVSIIVGYLKMQNDKKALLYADFYCDFVKSLIKNNQGEMLPIYRIFSGMYTKFNVNDKAFDCLEDVISELRCNGIGEKDICVLKEFTEASIRNVETCSENLIISAESNRKSRLTEYEKRGKSAVILYPCVAALIILIIV